MLALISKARSAHSFVLNQRPRKDWRNETVLFQESRLALSSDHDRIVLIRYIERYSPGGGQWVEYRHSAPIAEFNHWIMARGELQIACSDDRAGG